LTRFDTGLCLRFPHQGQFHPLKYLAGLTQSIERQGSKIYTSTHVDKVQGGAAARVQTSNGTVVTAKAIVLATNTPITKLATVHFKQSAYNTFAIGVKLPHNSVPRALYWDTLDPYHYVRLQTLDQKSDLLIVGGEDEKTGESCDANASHRALETWTRERFPMAQEVTFRWSGQVMNADDGIAYIGKGFLDEENVYIATGDTGLGMTHGTIAGILLTDTILGRKNPWAEVYDPSRIRPSMATTTDFIAENTKTALHYLDWLTPGEVDSVEKIAPGTGAIVRRGLTKFAVYRDENNVVHTLSAVCTNLFCIVTWNNAEKAWDCPCHGSRFDCHGKVLTGPANRDLKPVDFQ
jgi:Rieske Fe-S protein